MQKEAIIQKLYLPFSPNTSSSGLSSSSFKDRSQYARTFRASCLSNAAVEYICYLANSLRWTRYSIIFSKAFMVVDLKLRISYMHGSARSSVFWPKYITSLYSDFSLPISLYEKPRSMHREDTYPINGLSSHSHFHLLFFPSLTCISTSPH